MSGNEQLTDASVDSRTQVSKSAAGRMVSPTGTQLKSAFPARSPGPTVLDVPGSCGGVRTGLCRTLPA